MGCPLLQNRRGPLRFENYQTQEKNMKLTKYEKQIDKDIAAGLYVERPISKKERAEIRAAAKETLAMLPRRQSFYDIRTALRLTQKDMAEALRVSERTVQSWEVGARNIPEPMLLLVEFMRDVPAVRKRLKAA